MSRVISQQTKKLLSFVEDVLNIYNFFVGCEITRDNENP